MYKIQQRKSFKPRLVMGSVNIYGAGGHAKVIVDIIHSRKKEKIGDIFDDNSQITQIAGYEVHHHLNTKNPLIIGIGSNEIRCRLAGNYPGEIASHISHRSAVISSSTKIGKGTVVMANTSINPEVTIGEHCIVNTGAVIEHEVKIEDFVHIGPNSAIAGQVKIGEGSHIGINACIIQNVRIGKWATVGAGSVVLHDVPDFAVVVGSPARFIKYNSKRNE